MQRNVQGNDLLRPITSFQHKLATAYCSISSAAATPSPAAAAAAATGAAAAAAATAGARLDTSLPGRWLL